MESYLLVAVILFLLELLYLYVANRYNIVDKPNMRSSHKKVTVLGGGFIFIIGAWLGALFFGISDPWFLLGLSIVALISFADDINTVPNWVRLSFHFIAIFLIIFDIGILNFHYWWWILAVLVLSVGVVNAFNFMDGINGMTGGYSLVVVLSILIINMKNGLDLSLLVVVGISLLIFCFFNFRQKALCFAGDVGAVSMAFIIIFCLCSLINHTKDPSYIIFLAVYGVDTVLTIIHRIMLRENLGEAHRKHAYQIMANELHIPHVVVALIYMGLQALVSAGLIWLPVNHFIYAAIVVLILCVAYIQL